MILLDPNSVESVYVSGHDSFAAGGWLYYVVITTRAGSVYRHCVGSVEEGQQYIDENIKPLLPKEHIKLDKGHVLHRQMC